MFTHDEVVNTPDSERNKWRGANPWFWKRRRRSKSNGRDSFLAGATIADRSPELRKINRVGWLGTASGWGAESEWCSTPRGFLNRAVPLHKSHRMGHYSRG